mmetsp:Transcript_33577/g.54619  ORF Transcript_33577/g.54619 Transcript_33577/m.54619 type:complete len:340 (-) Transcript_33577:492-1511(-)
MVHGDAPHAAQPGLGVQQQHAHVLHQCREGLATTLGRRQQLLFRHPRKLRGHLVDLVGPRHVRVEGRLGNGHEGGVGHPGAVVPQPRLALLVGRHRRHRPLVHRRVLGGDLRGHAPHGEGAPPVAGVDDLLHVRLQEGRGHAHRVAVRQQRLGVALELLDVAEDVVPAAAVHAQRVRAQLVQDLVHLEGRRDRLQQHRGAHRARGHAQVALGSQEDVVPEPGLQVALQLGQVEVGARAARQQPERVVVQVQPKVEERARHWPAVDSDVRLVQVPAARAAQQRGQLLPPARPRPVHLARLRVHVLDRAAHRVAQVYLTLNHRLPCGRAGVLKVRHVRVCP